MDALATQEGAQAVVLITDGQTSPDSGESSGEEDDESIFEEDVDEDVDVDDTGSILDEEDLDVLDAEESVPEDTEEDVDVEEIDEEAVEDSVAEESVPEDVATTVPADEADSGVDASQMAQIWPALDNVQPRIYAVHIAGGEPLDQDLMQDWAAVNNGIYTYARNQSDIDIAFDRAATILRRPSFYSLTVAAVAPPPPPTTTTTTTVPLANGTLNVLPAIVDPSLPTPTVGGASVGIIFDTSGSMLQQLPTGESRIDAGRAALTSLVTQTIPAGTNVSLRVFGNSPDSCQTNLISASGRLRSTS